MALKHQLKRSFRDLYARTLYHTGLHRLVDRLMPRRMTILFGHCVDEPGCNGFLPSDMKLRADTLERVIDAFDGRYDFRTIGAGHRSLAAGEKGPSVVALSFDDGYRDNRTALLPILERRGVPATVFLETRPLAERTLNWSHKWHWALARGDAEGLTRRYCELTGDAPTREKLEAALAEGARLAYHAKRVLKYDADPADRDRTCDALFRDAGGDEQRLCGELYLSWDDAKALARAGLELGGHTRNHVILSRLDAAAARAEVEGCREDIEREVGAGESTTFAYPFGRRWDYTDETRSIVRDAGFTVAVNTHAGTNDARTDPTQLRRVPVDDTTPLHLLVAEACGGFDLLRKLGVDLSE